jgi:hypothetical protein
MKAILQMKTHSNNSSHKYQASVMSRIVGQIKGHRAIKMKIIQIDSHKEGARRDLSKKKLLHIGLKASMISRNSRKQCINNILNMASQKIMQHYYMDLTLLPLQEESQQTV